ncbi:MAG TPA: radical SAM protein, partial [Candidatus Hydrogenedentes bacterium]|nr:radical SAM protein [Candidatus Hydrogenedentota bacterium]
MLPIIASRLLNWQDGQSAGPWRLMVFPTYRCNLKCGICVRSWQETHPMLLHELPDERWLRLVDEAAAMGVRVLKIGGGGEPMLRDKMVCEMCVRVKKHGMAGSLQTNGTHLSADSMETLIRARWDDVTISIDAPTEEINDAIRNKGVFSKTVGALQTLRGLKKKHQSKLPNVAIHTTVTALNYDCLEDMVDFSLANGVDMFSASPLLEAGLEETGYIMSAAQRADLPRFLNAAMEKADAHNLLHNLN